MKIKLGYYKNGSKDVLLSGVGATIDDAEIKLYEAIKDFYYNDMGKVQNDKSYLDAYVRVNNDFGPFFISRVN